MILSAPFDNLIHWLHAHPHGGGFVAFFIAALESIAIIGTVVPGSIMMTGIGVLIGTAVLPLWSTMLWAIAGAITGDGISYIVGYHFKNRLRNLWPFRRFPQLLNKGEIFFKRHGGKSVFAGRFCGPVRAITPLIAGMMHFSPSRFIMANLASALLWAPGYFIPGIILGAASLQLPRHVAIHFFILVLGSVLCILFASWLARIIYIKVGDQLSEKCRQFWDHLQKTRGEHWITTLLKHHDPQETHGQLGTAIILVILLSLLLGLVILIATQTSPNQDWNQSVWHFFRYLRNPTTDHVILLIAYLGDKTVIVPAAFVLFLSLMITRQSRTALHWLALTILVAGTTYLMKNFVHSPRPSGLLVTRSGFSFPSAHVSLSTAYYTFLAKLMFDHFKCYRRFIYGTAAVLISTVALSRLYFGVHWLTDVAAGFLLGMSCMLIVKIAYHRKPSKPIKPMQILIVFCTALLGFSAITTYRFYNQQLHDYQLTWPITNYSSQEWWQNDGLDSPSYRDNLLGHPKDFLNVQWAGELSLIQETLEKHGWEVTHKIDWKTLAHPVLFAKQVKYQPLTAKKFDGKKPALMMIKKRDDLPPLLFYLWDAHVLLTPNQQPLWIGRVDYRQPDRYTKQPITATKISPIDNLEKDMQPGIIYKKIPVIEKEKKMYLLLIKS